MAMGPEHHFEAEKNVGKWFDDFKDMVQNRMVGRQNDLFNAWAIPAWWFQLQAGRHAAKGAEKSGDQPMFIIMVTDENGKLVDTEKYRLWIRGFRSRESVCEDFPPIQWP
jgi:hypothetical protein